MPFAQVVGLQALYLAAKAWLLVAASTEEERGKQHFAPSLVHSFLGVGAKNKHGRDDGSDLDGHGSDDMFAADPSCESDAQWLEVKHKLYYLLADVQGGGKLDPSRSVNVLTRGISSQDMIRCPVGAAGVQLFLQLTLALTDPVAAFEVLLAEPWPDTQDEPWRELCRIPWSAILASRWPFFQTLDALRSLYLQTSSTGALAHRIGKPSESCAAVWSQLPADVQHSLQKGDDAGLAMGVALSLPAESCAPARATVTLAVLVKTCSTSMCSSAGGEQQLLIRAQSEATSRWPLELISTPWPALALLSATAYRDVPEVMRRGLTGALHGAIVYVNFQAEERRSARDIQRSFNLERSLQSLRDYWLRHVPRQWPIFVFADYRSAPDQETSLKKAFPDLDIRITMIGEKDLSHPMPTDNDFCSRGYRRAARFMAGPLYTHEALDGFSHVMLIDTEFDFTHPVPWDPFQHMYEQRTQLAYWQAHYEGTWNRTVFLTEISREFMRANGRTPQIPELVQYWWDYGEADTPTGSLPVNIYGCLFAGAMDFLRSPLFQSYFNLLDTFEAGWDEYCWSPQAVLAIAAGFFLNDGDLAELWIFGRHQSSSKSPDEGWNLSGKGVLPRGQRPLDLLPANQITKPVPQNQANSTPT